MSYIHKDSMVFCEVDDTLCKIIHELVKGKTIIDCGCGLGLFEFKMKKLFPQQKIISVDINKSYDALIENIIRADCLSVEPNINIIPMFIRPCHSGFVTDYILKYKNKLKYVLYIGLEENLDTDLLDDNYDIISDWVGADGERIYRIKCDKFNGGIEMNTYSRVFDREMYEHCGHDLSTVTEEDKNINSSWRLIQGGKK